MGKQVYRKTTQKGSAIRFQIARGLTNAQISKTLGVNESLVRYYRRRPEKLMVTRASKLDKKYIDEIYELGANKTTKEMSGGLIAIKINKRLKEDGALDKKGKPITITRRQVNNILKEKYGSPVNIRTVFFLNEETKKKRVEFCKKVLEMGLEGKNIFFTDETKIDTVPLSGDKRRLTEAMKEKIREGDSKASDLTIKMKKKFENSIKVAGGISFYGLSDLILLKGTMNDFTYPQALSYFKENYDSFKEKNENLYFEQDGATCHTSKSSKKILEKFFPGKILQNPPHSPDLAYPIETIWAELKEKVKIREPKSMEDLKQFTIEEWNKIPLYHVQNRFKNYIKKCKKIIELEGDRLRNKHMNRIRKKIKKIRKSNENEKDDEEKSQENKEIVKSDHKDLKLKIVFSEEELSKKLKKEISFLKQKIKIKKRENREMDKIYKELKILSTEERRNIRVKDIEIQNYKFRIKWLKKKKNHLQKYFEYFKMECQNREKSKTKSSSSDVIKDNNLNRRQKLEKKEDEFYTLTYIPKKVKKI